MFVEMAKEGRFLIYSALRNLGVKLNRISKAMRLLNIFRRLKKTWLSEILNIYTWKETWIAISLPLLIFVFPALWLSFLFRIPTPYNAILFWASFVCFVIASVWGNPFGRR